MFVFMDGSGVLLGFEQCGIVFSIKKKKLAWTCNYFEFIYYFLFPNLFLALSLIKVLLAFGILVRNLSLHWVYFGFCMIGLCFRFLMEFICDGFFLLVVRSSTFYFMDFDVLFLAQLNF